MRAMAFLDELGVAGVHVTREGDRLRVRGKPGVSLTPYTDRIREHKPALLDILALQDEIVAAAIVEPSRFDRTAYEDLWRRWHALAPQEVTP